MNLQNQFTRILVEATKKIKIKFGGYLCRFGMHKYFHYHEKRPVEGLPQLHITEITVPVRECDRCGYREHHLMPLANGFAYNWKPYPREQQDVLRFREHGQ